MFAVLVRETLAGSAPLSFTCHHGAEICYKHHHLTDAPFFVILILSATLSFVETKPMVSPTTYVYKGITCVKCPVGTRVSKHCTESFHNSTCAACEPGTYQSLQHTDLETCGVCDKGCQDVNAVVVDNCTADHNLRCQCDDGYYNKHHAQGVMACVRFSKCQHGQTVRDKGGPQRDVVCDWCPRGQFYNATSDQCSYCTMCADSNMTTRSPCTRETNAVCARELTTDMPVSPRPSRNDYKPIIIPSSVIGALLLTAAIITYIIYRHSKRKKAYRHSNRKTENIDASRRRTSNLERENSSEEPFLEEERPVPVPVPLPSPTDKGPWSKKVFLHLSLQRVPQWRMFIRHLPVKTENTFDADRELEFNTDSKGTEKIYQLLIEWYRSCYDIVSIQGIISALENSRNSQLVRGVIEVYNEAVRANENTKSAGTTSEDPASKEEVIGLSSYHDNDANSCVQRQPECREQTTVLQEDTDICTARADQKSVAETHFG